MDMDREIKREAKKQYFKYFRIWFIITGVILAATILAVVIKTAASDKARGNSGAPAERVYDYADSLSEKEIEKLEQHIAQCEKEGQIDIVLLITNQPMGISDSEWERNMKNTADDFYDEAAFGYNRPHGDGALLLYNWYVAEDGTSHKGVWLSASGKMEDTIGWTEEDAVLSQLEKYIETDPCKAYSAAISNLAYYGKNGYQARLPVSWVPIILVPLAAAIAYAFYYSRQSKAQDTTSASTYVESGRPVLRLKSDDFLRKNVVSHRIETSSSGGSSGHRGGGSGGHHVSSGGYSHGGGGRRH